MISHTFGVVRRTQCITPKRYVAVDATDSSGFHPSAAAVAHRSNIVPAAAGPTVMAGKVLPQTPAVPVTDAAMGPVFPGRGAFASCWVPVDPVVGGAVEVVVIQPGAISKAGDLVFLVGGVRPALAVGAECLGVGSADGGR